MKRAALIVGALLLVILALGAAALWFVTMPWRLLARMYLPARRRRPGKGVAIALVESTFALALSAFGLTRTRGRIGPAWHPCENCGAPIDLPSRAAYCSQACRRDANIRSRAALDGWIVGGEEPPLRADPLT